jgi:hypothetical protein
MAKPKSAPLIKQLSEKHQELVRRIIKRYHGDLSRLEYFRLEERRSKTEIDKYTGKTWYQTLLDNVKENNACTDEEAVAIATANLLGRELLDRGVARRIVHDDPSELECALGLGTRLEWIEGCMPWRRWDDRYPEIWTVFRGLAAGDLAVARAYFGPKPKNLTGGHKVTVMIYNAVQAIVTENKGEQAKLLPKISSPVAPDWCQAILHTLAGIIQHDELQVAGELEHVLFTIRRAEFHEHEKIISPVGHGLAELAYWVSPKLLAAFNVERPLPWDSAYYRWLRRKNRSAKYLDLSKQSPLLHRWIHDLDEPGWWAKRPRS